MTTRSTSSRGCGCTTGCEPGPRSAVPQPVMTVRALPSADRAAIRAWIDATVMDSLRAWPRAAETAPQTWRDATRVDDQILALGSIELSLARRLASRSPVPAVVHAGE